MNFLMSQPDRLQSRIHQTLACCRNRSGEAELVGGCHAVNDGACLVSTGNGTDDRAEVGHVQTPGQLTGARAVVQAPDNAVQIVGNNQALQGLVKGILYIG